MHPCSLNIRRTALYICCYHGSSLSGYYDYCSSQLV